MTSSTVRFPVTICRLLAVAAVAAVGQSARADQIDRAFARDAAAVTKAVRDLGAKSVAVLKFQVQVGDDRPTFQAGTLGSDMVHRVENLLVLSADPTDPNPVVLTGAGDQAAKLSYTAHAPIDWTTPEGRAKLFGLELPVAWDAATKVAPDGFVTGTVRVSADLKTVFVDLVGFTRTDPATLKPLASLDGGMTDGKPHGIRTDRGILAALGKTFNLPPKLPQTARSRQVYAADDAAVADAAKRKSVSAADASGPVKLDVYYDGNPISPEPDPNAPGEFRLPTPAAGQKVRFDLTNTGPDKVAVLLTVNGRNTIATEGEDLAAPGVTRERFRTWVLEPDPAKKYTINGFLQDLQGTTRPFAVLANDQSRQAFDALAPTYAGKIHMMVYGKRPRATLPPVGKTDPPPTEQVTVEPVPVDTTPADPAPVGRPSPPEPAAEPGKEVAKEGRTKTVEAAGDDIRELNEGIDAGGLVTVAANLGKSRDLSAAQDVLRKRLQLAKQPDGRLASTKPKTGKKRGLIVDDGSTTTNGPVEVVRFDYDPLPIGSVVIGYYTKTPGR